MGSGLKGDQRVDNERGSALSIQERGLSKTKMQSLGS